jgi:L-aspartate oxidase
MEFDVIVIGSGIAGSVAAYTLSQQGFHTALLSKNPMLEESNTFYAQGGIVYKGEADSAELLFNDIMSAGAWICNPEAVKVISEEGSRIVEEVLIREFQVPFTLDEKGNLLLTKEGAHSARRILFTKDATGRSIELSAVAAIRRRTNLTILEDFTAIDIITMDHHTSDKLRMYQPITSLGVYALNNKTKVVSKILSRAVVLATGGMGQAFLHTTNPLTATGDGFAMAARAGARLVNMEYTQFHPTSLFHPKASNFLISESVRGEGAILVDRKGKAFMEQYHPLKDLAPRDIVTRAILTEMQEQDESYMFLDIARIGKETVKERFPNIYRKCLDYGYDITEDPIPVLPAYHFSCGGILTDMNGATSIRRLFAAGEVACTGLHGANRLASTSLLEGLVFGRRVAEYLAGNWKDFEKLTFPDVPEWIDTGIVEDIDSALIIQDWNSLKNIMWNYVGPVRNKKRLRRAMIDLNNLREDIENFYRDAKVNKPILELRNAVQTGLIVAQQALANRRSDGAHFRVD